MYNLPNGCGGRYIPGECAPPSVVDIQNQTFAPSIELGYLGFTSDGGGGSDACCPMLKANGRIINNARDSIEITTEIRNGNDIPKRRIFLGKKV